MTQTAKRISMTAPTMFSCIHLPTSLADSCRMEFLRSPDDQEIVSAGLHTRPDLRIQTLVANMAALASQSQHVRYKISSETVRKPRIPRRIWGIWSEPQVVGTLSGLPQLAFGNYLPRSQSATETNAEKLHILARRLYIRSVSLYYKKFSADPLLGLICNVRVGQRDKSPLELW